MGTIVNSAKSPFGRQGDWRKALAFALMPLPPFDRKSWLSGVGLKKAGPWFDLSESKSGFYLNEEGPLKKNIVCTQGGKILNIPLSKGKWHFLSFVGFPLGH